VKPITLTGTTKPFEGYGRSLGYPTANIAVSTDLADGVYFGFADLGTIVHNPALIFIGTPITLGQHGRRVEAHLLDIPDTDYYDQTLTLTLHTFHRPNQKFESMETLVAAMKSDETVARSWFLTNA
jgi:riboflavin kinase/FMN adenylyltransferase